MAVGPVVDAETGFRYLRARHYDPAMGQFLNRDPITRMTRDAYGYAARSPLSNSDPSGLCGQLAPGVQGPYIPCGQYLQGASANSQALQNTINQLFRPGASIGDGGSADALRHEACEPSFDTAASHYTKVCEQIATLKNLVRRGLDDNDETIAENLLEDLQSAKVWADEAVSAVQAAEAVAAAAGEDPSLLEQVLGEAGEIGGEIENIGEELGGVL